MGIFNRFSKRERADQFTGKTPSTDSLQAFQRDLIQEVALLMNAMGITSQPILKFFYNDQGIFEGIFLSHSTDPQMVALKRQNKDLYLTILGCHALGTAAYVAICQDSLNKPVDKFSQSELSMIAGTLHANDAYEVALNALNFSPESSGKKCLDTLVLRAISFTKQAVGEKIMDSSYQRVFMNVMYNAGVTLVMGE